MLAEKVEIDWLAVWDWALVLAVVIGVMLAVVLLAVLILHATHHH